MPDISEKFWTEQDDRNTESQPNGWPGNMPAQIDTVGRMMMGAVKRSWRRSNPYYQTTGTNDDYVVEPDVSFPRFNDFEVLRLRVDRANTTTAPTLQFGEWPLGQIRKVSSTGVIDLAPGDIVAGADHQFWYDGLQFILANPGTLDPGIDANLMHRSANLADVEDVEEARDNLGLGTAATANADEFATAAQGALADTALQVVTDADLAAPANITYLNQTETTLDFYGGDVVEMFSVSPARKFSIGAGNIEFDEVFSIPAGAQLSIENGAIFIPTFEPVGTARATPLITLGAGVCANYLKMQLDTGINTIRKGLQVGDNSQIGYIECTSADLNNNRTESGSTDLISGAVIITGQHVRIDQMVLSRFDRGWTVVDSTDVQIGHIRNLETLMGGYVHGTRDLHVSGGYSTGASVADAATLSRGPMTPGLNSLVLAGCSDSSFSNWYSFDILEHAVRVGGVASGTTVPNHRIGFINHQHYRPYGCGFKCDDGDTFNIKRILIQGLYTEDVGHDNWFGSPGYQNWSSGGVNNPASDNDGNKAGCAIRNSQYVTLQGYSNKSSQYANSGYFGLWIERSNYVQGSNIDVEKALHEGVVVQSGGSTSPDRIELRGVAARDNGGSGVKLDATPANTTWRGTQVIGIDSQLNAGYGVEITARQDGASPYATLTSRIEGWVRGNTLGGISLNANVAADPDFVDDTEETGTFTPSITFATPGDLALTAVTASGRWTRKGRRVYVELSYTGTPTYTTASGDFRLTGLPFAAAGGLSTFNIQGSGVFTWPASRTQVFVLPISGQTYCNVRGLGTNIANSTAFAVSEVPSGTAVTLNFAGEYRI